jgi:hypothetical protein
MMDTNLLAYVAAQKIWTQASFLLRYKCHDLEPEANISSVQKVVAIFLE